jgi:hypothetical protein
MNTETSAENVATEIYFFMNASIRSPNPLWFEHTSRKPVSAFEQAHRSLFYQSRMHRVGDRRAGLQPFSPLISKRKLHLAELSCRHNITGENKVCKWRERNGPGFSEIQATRGMLGEMKGAPLTEVTTVL